MTVSRRLFLRGSAAVVGAAGLAAITAKKATAGVAPNVVGYRDTPSGNQQCSDCKLFVAPNSCRIVDGVISPHGWCQIWAKA